MKLVNFNQTIDKNGNVILMKTITITTKPSTLWSYKYTKRGQILPVIRKIKGKKELQFFPHSCCICYQTMEKGKKLIPYEHAQGRKYAHIYCWYKSIKKKKETYEEGFKKYKSNFNELTKKYPKELLIEELKENEHKRF